MATLAACGSDDGGINSDEQLALTATEAVQALSQGRLTAEAYVRTVLDRAQALAGLNAVITLDEAGALAAARAVDARRRSGAALPPLAGLPIIVKDNINTAHLPTTGGTAALQHLRPSANAPTLAKLLDAGVIVIGKANLHELSMGITSSNLTPFAGPVKNPYDTTRVPGGSSGGTAAAIAARIVAAGLGTDTGGSVRVPSALCGIAGLRPSVGDNLAQRRYHDENAVVPLSHTRDTIGPMGRTVADVALLDAAITGGSVPQAADLRGLRLGVPLNFWQGLDSALEPVALAAKARLAAAGVVMVGVDLSDAMALSQHISFLFGEEVLVDMPAYLAASNGGGLTFDQIRATIASPDVRAVFDVVAGRAFEAGYPDALAVHRPALQAMYAACFADHGIDALLFPTTILAAVPIDAANGSSVSVINGTPANTLTTLNRNADPGSVAGLPGLSVPAGLTAGGLPVGLELDGPIGSDRRLLAIGMAIEAVLGPLPAPKV
ncbi:indoleacetamide hydrolase [Aquincola sp. MAHUQ-54]|uniref:Indoleacetamide hydrolase n=1 Tax=Aquincola agrisoli TaxID=3119538 RepID=A0AAW9QGS2_9BURK